MKNYRNTSRTLITATLLLVSSVVLSSSSCTNHDEPTPANPAGTAVKTYTVNLGWGYEPVTPPYLNLPTGTTYTLANGAGNAEQIDLIGYHYYGTGACWFAPSSCDATTSWSRRKGTAVSYSSINNFSHDDFLKVTTSAQLVKLSDDNMVDVSGRTQSPEEGYTFPVKTFEGKRGLVYLSKIAGNENDAQAYMTLEIKMEQ